jgi:hypothetical protein
VTLLKACRVLSGTTLQTLADAVLCDKGTLSLLERSGKRKVGKDLQRRLASYFKTPDFDTLTRSVDGAAFANLLRETYVRMNAVRG